MPGLDFLTAEQAEAYDPFTIIYEVPRSTMPHIYLDAGTADPLISQARELVRLADDQQCAVLRFARTRAATRQTTGRRSIGGMMAVQNEVSAASPRQQR